MKPEQYLTRLDDSNGANYIDPINNSYYRLEDNIKTVSKFWKALSVRNNRIENDYSSSEAESDLSDDDSPSEVISERNKLCLAEIIPAGQKVPLKINFRFKLPRSRVKARTKPYSDRMITNLLFRCYEAIKERYNLDGKINVCLMIRPTYNRDNKSIVDIKFHYIGVRINSDEANTYLKPLLLQRLNEDILNLFHEAPDNDWDDIISFNEMSKFSYLLYTDSPTYPFKIKGFYSFGGTRNGVLTHLSDFFDPIKHDHVIKRLLDIPKNPKLESHKSLLLSNGYDPVVTQIRHNDPSNAQERFIKIEDDTRLMKRAIDYLNLIDVERVQHKHSWISIGRALYNEFKGSKRALELWKDFSYLGKKFPPSVCAKEWSKMKDDYTNYLSINTLEWFAKKDDPDVHTELVDKEFTYYIQQSIAKGHNKSGRPYEETLALATLIRLRYIATVDDRKKVHWFRYTNNHWKEINSLDKLYNFVSKQYTYKLENLIDTIDPDEDKKVIKRLKALIGKMIFKAGDLVPKKKLVEHTRSSIIKEDLVDILDSNRCYFGVRNGVIDTSDDWIFFREAKPEDFICKQSKVKYRADFNWRTKSVVKFTEWMDQVQPNTEERDYMLKLFARQLKGGNSHKSAVFLIGDTGGGKTGISKLNRHIIGDYAGTLPSSHIEVSKNYNNSNPDPFLCQNMNNNSVWIAELSNQIDDRVYKRFTGDGDGTPVRDLHESGSTNKDPRFAMFIYSNFAPQFRLFDDSVNDRTLFLFLKSQWSKNAPKTKEEQYRQRIFPRDDNFNTKVHCMGEAALWAFVEYFKKELKEGIKTPKPIEEAKKEWLEQTDSLGAFINDRITIFKSKSEQDRAILTGKEAVDYYRQYMGQYYPDCALPNLDQIEVAMKQRLISKGLGNYDNNIKGWYDLTINYQVDE